MPLMDDVGNIYAVIEKGWKENVKPKWDGDRY
jgi:hypothetical protein